MRKRHKWHKTGDRGAVCEHCGMYREYRTARRRVMFKGWMLVTYVGYRQKGWNNDDFDWRTRNQGVPTCETAAEYEARTND